MLGNFEKHPDVALASHYGEPTMVDPAPTNPRDVVGKIAAAALTGSTTGDEKTGVIKVNGTPAPNAETPRSDSPAAAGDAAATPADAAAGTTATAELKANVADPNELKPNVEADPNALPPLQQSNQLDNGGGLASAPAVGSTKPEEMADISSSKKKKKKGLAKLNPF